MGGGTICDVLVRRIAAHSRIRDGARSAHYIISFIWLNRALAKYCEIATGALYIYKSVPLWGPGVELPYLGIFGPKHIFGHILP